MSKQILRIGRKKIFPLYIRILLTIVVGFALVFILKVNDSEDIYLFLMILLSSIVPAIWTARYLFVVDATNKTYGLFTWVMGMKFGEKISFTKLNGLRKQLNPNFREEEIDFDSSKFLIYLDINEGEKIPLLSGNNEEELTSRINIIKGKLKTEMIH